MRTMAASAFKAKCLAVLDSVAATGEPITILKRGRPVAELICPRPRGSDFPQKALLGSVRIRGDVTKPVLPPDAWEAEHGRNP
jgi:prevent-host-death family protein